MPKQVGLTNAPRPGDLTERQLVRRALQESRETPHLGGAIHDLPFHALRIDDRRLAGQPSPGVAAARSDDAQVTAHAKRDREERLRVRLPAASGDALAMK